MHSPGVCGVILAAGSQVGAGDARSTTKAAGLSELIEALNGDTEMILVAVGADAEALAPVAWAKAAYVVQLPDAVSNAETLRTMLREVLNRGRDAALVIALDQTGVVEAAVGGNALPQHPVTIETVHRMVAAYCAAGDEIWAVVPDTAMQQGHPVLMGRRMIELFLRGQKWSAADEILSAKLEHVHTVMAVDPLAAPVIAGAAWKAPWD